MSLVPQNQNNINKGLIGIFYDEETVERAVKTGRSVVITCGDMTISDGTKTTKISGPMRAGIYSDFALRKLIKQ